MFGFKLSLKSGILAFGLDSDLIEFFIEPITSLLMQYVCLQIKVCMRRNQHLVFIESSSY